MFILFDVKKIIKLNDAKKIKLNKKPLGSTITSKMTIPNNDMNEICDHRVHQSVSQAF